MRPKASETGGLAINVDEGEVTFVRVAGRIDIDSSPDLRDRLRALLLGQPYKEQPHKVITVDLAEVPYIDTSGIATLVEALKIARKRQSTLCLQGLNGSVLRLFQATNVLALFEASGCAANSSGSKVS